MLRRRLMQSGDGQRQTLSLVHFDEGIALEPGPTNYGGYYPFYVPVDEIKDNTWTWQPNYKSHPEQTRVTNSSPYASNLPGRYVPDGPYNDYYAVVYGLRCILPQSYNINDCGGFTIEGWVKLKDEDRRDPVWFGYGPDLSMESMDTAYGEYRLSFSLDYDYGYLSCNCVTTKDYNG